MAQANQVPQNVLSLLR
ncbi:hypothetical protein [Salmonella enterica]|nr:hypothetical protein [Salmonella enterica]MDI5050272.1 hypothetical protein [Salmonella enterica subsp. enterica serovar Montevideo]